ncbi:MAG: chloride channel protein, partial [Ectothiorhodospiraceae bacterium]
WITQTVAPEARGHGVPEVLGAIYYSQGRIRPIVVVAKAVASAVSIGTGGSVGREGPIIQIGAAFGSALGQISRLPARQCIVLISAGAGAGIAATFNAPVGGLAFAIELLLVTISARTVAMVAVATVTATYVGRIYSGLEPSFDVPDLAVFENHLVGLYTMILCVPLGLFMGYACSVFIRSIYFLEDWFEAHIPNAYVRHAAGMFLVGVMLYAFLWRTQHYYIGGVGYATIMDILRSVLTDPWFLLLLFAAKLLATGLTLGSGASGGVFSPALFLGATLGSAFGGVILWLFPASHVNSVVFAVAGMAAMVGGSTGAVVTAITMIFEQTRDYSAMLPIITTVALAYASRTYFTSESIYTLKLFRRGFRVPQGLQAAVSHMLTADRIMNPDFEVVEMDDLREWETNYKPGQNPRYTVISRDGEVVGMMRDELAYLLRDQDPEQVVDKQYFTVTTNTRLPTITRGMRAKEADRTLVFRRRYSRDVNDIAGIITPREIVHSVGANAELQD